MKRIILTLQEVAAILRASIKTVRRRIEDGQLKAFKEGGRILVLESELEKYLQRVTQGAITQ
jgi:excisionase family DNA binding protein